MTVLHGISSQQTAHRRVRIPIRIKLTIPYLLLSIALAVAAAYIITQLIVENLQERFTKQIYEAGKIASELMVSYESQLLETERLLANVQGAADAIRAGDAEGLRSLTLGIVANDQQDAAEFFDLSGNHVLSIRHHPGGNPEEYLYASGGLSELSEQDVVQSVLSAERDEQGDKFAAVVETDLGSFLYVSGPVRDSDGNIVGAVLVGRSLGRIATEMRAKTFAQITFYDRSGQVIESTLPFAQAIAPEIASQTAAFKDIRSTTRELATERSIESANIPFTEILGSWEVRGDQEIGVLGVSLSQGAIVQSSASSRWRIFALVASANFLIILVGINLANTITRPLLQLVQASLKVSSGELDVRVHPQSQDEISILTESFNMMVASLNQSRRNLVQAYDSTLEGWAKALELRDKETEGHSERVTALTLKLAEAFGIAGEALVNIRRGALLHDIGKMGVPDSILHKNGPLNLEERKVIERHPQNAYDILKDIEYLQAALEIPYCHHEKWDGSGYPRGLRGEDIPVSARMFAIVDVFDALISDRPYRKAMPREEVLAFLRAQSGTHFDPQVLDMFLKVLDQP